MKKFITLALALVMVLGIAASALAAGWGDISDPAPVPGPIEISVDALSPDKKSSNLWTGSKGYAVLESGYPVVEDDVIHALITVDFPKSEKISDDVKDALGTCTNPKHGKQGTFQVRIFTENLYLLEVNADNGVTRTFTAGQKVKTQYIDVTAEDDLEIEIWAIVLESEKDTAITAKCGVYNVWDGGKFSFVKNDAVYNVEHDGNDFIVSEGDGTDTVTFSVKDATKGALDTTKPVVVTMDGADYAVTKQTNNALAFVDGNGKINADATDKTYKALKAILDDVCGALGFSYEGADYMTEAHFEKYFGIQSQISDKVVYGAGMVQQVVPAAPADASVTPPQTGDNASIAGFVMIAVALIAAGAVTLKKVRA